MKTLITLLALILSTNAAAVEFIPKGTPAPYDGYLFTPTEERQIRLINEQLKFTQDYNLGLVTQNKAYKDNWDIQEQRIQNLQDANRKFADQAISAQNSSTIANVAIFGAGILTAVLAAYMVKQVAK